MARCSPNLQSNVRNISSRASKDRFLNSELRIVSIESKSSADIVFNDYYRIVKLLNVVVVVVVRCALVSEVGIGDVQEFELIRILGF